MAHPLIGESDLQRALVALDQCLQDYAWQPGDNYLILDSLYHAVQTKGITLAVIDTLLERLIHEQVFRPYCHIRPAGTHIEQGWPVFRSETESTHVLITTRERWYRYLAEATRASVASATTSPPNSRNPYRELLSLALQIHEEELQRAGRVASGARQPLQEWQQHLRQRERQVQQWIEAGLHAAERTGFGVAEVERRLLAVAGPIRAFLVWQREVRQPFSNHGERSGSWPGGQDVVAAYFSRHYQQLMTVWESVHTLAVRLDGARPTNGADPHEPRETAGENAQATVAGLGSPAERACAPGPAANEDHRQLFGVPPDSGTDLEFNDFPRKQRLLLWALRGQQDVPINDLMRSVYGSTSTSLSTFERLLGRTNQNLTNRGYRFEIKRKNNTLRLQPI
jgi:hypothetical protein